LLFAAAEHRNGQRPDERRGGDDPERGGERHRPAATAAPAPAPCRHARSQCVERALGRVADHELRPDVMADDRRETRGLFVIRFDGQNNRHRKN
jgi:hypothetical protein